MGGSGDKKLLRFCILVCGRAVGAGAAGKLSRFEASIHADAMWGRYTLRLRDTITTHQAGY